MLVVHLVRLLEKWNVETDDETDDEEEDGLSAVCCTQYFR